MNYPVLEETRAWTVTGGDTGDFVGGYVTHYANNFTFATVRGAGHMVPETRSQAALALVGERGAERERGGIAQTEPAATRCRRFPPACHHTTRIAPANPRPFVRSLLKNFISGTF